MSGERRVFKLDGGPLHNTECGKLGNISRCKDCGIVFAMVSFESQVEYVILKEGRAGVHTHDYCSKFLSAFNGAKYPLLGIRKDTFLRFFILCLERRARAIVETGTITIIDWERGGCSTLLFGDYCAQNSGHLWTIDSDAEAIGKSKELSKKYANFITYYYQDSIEALRQDRPPASIDAIYLDSFDYMGDEDAKQKSREHHLREIETVYPKLHDKSIIMIDDCKPPDGTRGKGELVIPWLEERGWVVDCADYQVILTKKLPS